ncbi:MAG: hypothetical protein EOL86_09150 [Deltaproteobacteria bacterium]|nr:hypothetical protein [Deltaproteobacteria bacterium]
MSTMIENIDGNAVVRVMQRRLDRAQACADTSARLYAEQVERANRATADLIRAREANAVLLARLSARDGFPVLPLLVP